MDISRFSANLFWDADVNDLDFDVHKAYVVGRVLDYGEWDDWLAIRSYYGMEELKKIALRIRTMFPKSLSFIATVTNTPENEFRCYEQVKNKKNANHFIA
ncbi:MAG: hypothetical protein LBG47_09260 [Prevotellaceae bacterium]|jgi:hypothetical protein|nr:hypothetical protein [Prevotellaceae bacterium]